MLRQSGFKGRGFAVHHCFALELRPFSSKIPELEVRLQKNDVDVAVVQETKLREGDGERVQVVDT